MSINFIELAEIKSIDPHPNAERLEIAFVHGYQTVVPKGQFTPGQTVVYFPPDMCIDVEKAKELGVANYLKHAEGVQCRVGAAKLRGQPSYGFVIGLDKCNVPSSARLGEDLSHLFGGYKYQPPERTYHGDQMPDHPSFHHYTDIQNYARYPVIEEGTPVRITEKLHGTNARAGLIRVDGEFQFMCGSRTDSRKEGVYWKPMTEEVINLLTELCDEQNDVIVFGEIFGPGIQNMHYGQKEKQFRVFDISVNGKYLDWGELAAACDRFGVAMVPLVYQGPFSKGLLGLAEGKSLIGGPLREGIVITPLKETWSPALGDRLILKYINAEYLGR